MGCRQRSLPAGRQSPPKPPTGDPAVSGAGDHEQRPEDGDGGSPEGRDVSGDNPHGNQEDQAESEDQSGSTRDNSVLLDCLTLCWVRNERLPGRQPLLGPRGELGPTA